MSPLLLPLPCPSPAHFKPVPPAHKTHEAFCKSFKILLQGPAGCQYLGDFLQALCTRKPEDFTVHSSSTLSGYFDDSIPASRSLKLDLFSRTASALKHRKMTVMRTIRLGG
ncbi:hypothetical protein B0H12DRAFT_1127266, partial [Mycena haematopus]